MDLLKWEPYNTITVGKRMEDIISQSNIDLWKEALWDKYEYFWNTLDCVYNIIHWIEMIYTNFIVQTSDISAACDYLDEIKEQVEECIKELIDKYNNNRTNIPKDLYNMALKTLYELESYNDDKSTKKIRDWLDDKQKHMNKCLIKANKWTSFFWELAKKTKWDDIVLHLNTELEWIDKVYEEIIHEYWEYVNQSITYSCSVECVSKKMMLYLSLFTRDYDHIFVDEFEVIKTLSKDG